MRYRLLSRFSLIVALPIIAIQAVSLFMFYYKHWPRVSDRMVRSVVTEIEAVLLYRELERLFSFEITELTDEAQMNSHKSSSFIPEIHQLNSRLQAVGLVKLNCTCNDSYVTCLFKEGNQNYSLSFETNRIRSHTTTVFIVWVTSTSLVLLLIALISTHYQFSSIGHLVEFAKKLASRQDIKNFNPSGPREIRAAGFALLSMKRAMEKNVQSRLRLLTQISHDLRTPITRMKLQLALIKGNQKAMVLLNSNLCAMEKMLLSYLDFVNGEGNELCVPIDLQQMLSDILIQFGDERIFLVKTQPILLSIRTNAMRRAVCNLLDNAVKFAGSRIELELYTEGQFVVIAVGDDGLAEKPETGFGLGLEIVKSILYGHGGEIEFGKSHLGGLKVIMKLPS